MCDQIWSTLLVHPLISRYELLPVCTSEKFFAANGIRGIARVGSASIHWELSDGDDYNDAATIAPVSLLRFDPWGWSNVNSVAFRGIPYEEWTFAWILIRSLRILYITMSKKRRKKKYRRKSQWYDKFAKFYV